MSKTHCRFCEATVEGVWMRCPLCYKWLHPMADEPPMSLRTDWKELEYQNAKKEGVTVKLEEVESICEWKHWRLIPNQFPYNIAFQKHDMLVPKRIVGDRDSLRLHEVMELFNIKKELQSEYDLFFENTPSKRSVMHLYHEHCAKYYNSREEMTL